MNAPRVLQVLKTQNVSEKSAFKLLKKFLENQQGDVMMVESLTRLGSICQSLGGLSKPFQVVDVLVKAAEAADDDHDDEALNPATETPIMLKAAEATPKSEQQQQQAAATPLSKEEKKKRKKELKSAKKAKKEKRKREKSLSPPPKKKSKTLTEDWETLIYLFEIS